MAVGNDESGLASGLRTDGVPDAVVWDATQPLQRVVGATGVSHAQLRALAEGEGPAQDLLGRYRLDGCVGRGGMATVFGGVDLQSGRAIAVKVLDDVRGLRDDRLLRFVAEAEASSRLRHPNVVEVLDFGSTEQGVVFIVMELLDGEDLHRVLARRGSLAWDEVQSLVVQVCAGLEAVHASGMVHRDLKPGNCMVLRGSEPRLKLLDFGIATTIQDGRDARRLTVDGQVVGTPEYMSPEQARSEAVDARSDVYSVGVLLAELLTGRVPFAGKSATAVLAAQIYERPPTLAELRGTPVPAELEAVYARALAKDPEARYPSASALGEAIAGLTLDFSRPSRGPWWHLPGTSLAAAGLAFASLSGLS